MIVIIDYGVGNIRAFINIYKKLDIPIRVAKTASDLAGGVSKIILPGVGAFDYSMQRLNESGMRERLDELVIKEKVPVLGICVGMQILARSSDEGKLSGLNWIDGVVRQFDVNKIQQSTQLPHMGWNNVNSVKDNPLFKGLEDDARFYFLHSYYFECDHNLHSIAVAEYGLQFTCAINKDNIFGIQCHPEKSHESGTLLLKNFASL